MKQSSALTGLLWFKKELKASFFKIMFFINSLRFSIMYFDFICPILWLLSPDALPTSLPTKFCSFYFLAIEALNLSASLLYDSLLCDWLCLVHPRIIKLSTLTGTNELKEKDRHPCMYAGKGDRETDVVRETEKRGQRKTETERLTVEAE